MGRFRLPRFERSSAVAPVQLTERDRQIVRLVGRHRFLRSYQVTALIAGSRQQLLRRLQLLFHHGYLERPAAQNCHNHSNRQYIVYGLGNKGGDLLRRELGAAMTGVSWGEKNRSVSGIFFEHALLVSDVMVGIELSRRENESAKLTLNNHFPIPAGKSEQQWRVNLGRGVSLGVIPDRVFALEIPVRGGGSRQTLFFLEVDRGTMPIVRRRLTQTSFRRKLLAYEATWSQAIHLKRFGLPRFRVLVVTSSRKRLDSIIEATRRLPRGRGLFLFTDFASLLHSPSILTYPWETTSPGIQGTLVG